MPVQFVNINPPGAALPATLAVLCKGDLYRARLLHAEGDHYRAPLARRPAQRADPHYHIVLVTAGSGRFLIDGVLHDATPGRVFFTSPREAHNFLNAEGDSAHYAEITFEMTNRAGEPLRIGFAELLSLWTNQPVAPLLRGAAPAPFRRLFADEIRALETRAHAPPDDLELSWLLIRVLRMALGSFFTPRGVSTPDVLVAVRDHIRAHFEDDLTLPRLAKIADLTPNYLARRFSRAYGRSPISFLLDVRMQAACQILRATSHSLEEVARRVGMDDVYYFSRLFRKRVGVSPGRYREQARQR